MLDDHDPRADGHGPPDDDRRKFLAACGKFAVVTPPALTVLLSTTLTSEAVARSGGGRDGPSRGGPSRNDRDLLEWLERLLSKFF